MFWTFKKIISQLADGIKGNCDSIDAILNIQLQTIEHLQSLEDRIKVLESNHD